MPTRLQHVSIARPPHSNAQARTFYGDLLGLEEVPSPVALAALDVIWYRLGSDTELHILVEETLGQDRSGRHFCLAVDDILSMRERCEAAGVTVVGDVPIPGRPRFFIRDPFGNLIELTSIEDDYLLAQA